MEERERERDERKREADGKRKSLSHESLPTRDEGRERHERTAVVPSCSEREHHKSMTPASLLLLLVHSRSSVREKGRNMDDGITVWLNAASHKVNMAWTEACKRGNGCSGCNTRHRVSE